MSKQRPGGRKRRTKVHRTRPERKPSSARRHEDDPTDLGLMRHVRDALAQPNPLHLLELVSALVCATDRRMRGRLDPGSGGPTLDELVVSFLDVDRPETTAVLTVIAVLATDDLLRARITRELAGRRHPLPPWLDHLDEVRPFGATEMVHLQRDGDNIMVGVALPRTYACTAVVYIDHNLGTLVKDAFFVPQALTDTEAAFRDVDHRAGADAGMTIRRIDPADARVRIAEAIDRGAMSYPPFETDTWPQCRPLVEWIIGMLPDGGSGYQRPELSDRERRLLMDRFFASSYAGELSPNDRRDHHDLLDIVIDYGAYSGTGDPLHWSPVAVELILVDWIPRKIIAPAPFLAKAPDLLCAYIRFCHAEQGIPQHLTAEALRAVDHWEPEYQRTIRSPRPQGPAALLAAMGVGLDADLVAGLSRVSFDPADHWRAMITGLEHQVGGPDALERLDLTPLPDEPFDWTPVAQDDRERVADVLALCDAGCDAVFDVEHRTAARRLLAQVAARDSSLLTVSTNPAYPAAAICWVVGKANATLGSPYATVLVKDLMAHLGLTGSVAERGYRMVSASGRARPKHSDAIELGSPALLVAAHRARIIDRRDRFTSLIAEHGAASRLDED